MELQIVQFFNQLGQGTIVDTFSYYFSWVPFLIVFWLILGLIAFIFDQKNGKWIFLGTIIVAIIYFVINDLIIKQTLASIFFRERPYLVHPDIISSGEMLIDSSFPSGHMSVTVAILSVYIYFYRKLWVWILAILFILLMAFSRMHNGMHYPTDVLAGTILGIGYGFLTIYIVNKIRHTD